MRAEYRLIMWLLAALCYIGSGVAADGAAVHLAQAFRVVSIGLMILSIGDVIIDFFTGNL